MIYIIDEFSVFRFRFWKWGKWVEVVVDDRLPFLANPDGSLKQPPRLAFASCKNYDRDFWVPLLEKGKLDISLITICLFMYIFSIC